ncbi:MAG: 3'-5' exonuclease [Candidatus Eiseniibacteriota bacterium]|jgi:DNA polymerase III epsilon subunit-like protein
MSHAPTAQARYSTDLVVLDLEASSPDPDANDIQRSNIIEVGAVRVDGRSFEVKDAFSELVRPRDIPIEPFITELTGISPEMVAECGTFEAVGRRFVEWYGPRNRSILAAWGVYYDVPLLRKECRAFGIDFRRHFVGGAMDVRTVALVWLAQHRIGTTGVTIERTLEKMGLGALGLNFHRALDDARAAAAILQVAHLGEARL